MPLVLPGGEAIEEPRDERHARLRKIRPEYADGPLVTVAGARHQAEAELIQGLLIEEGVPSVLKRTAGFDVPDFLAAGPRDVLVPETGRELRPRAALGHRAGADGGGGPAAPAGAR